jgi:ribonuclease HI
MKNLALLLDALSRGESLDCSWRAAGFSSREEAAEALRLLGRSLATKRTRPGGAPGPGRARAPAEGGPSLERAVVYVDGASRGNPGPAAAAAVAYLPSGEELTCVARKLGSTTNNVAEYRAVIEGLRLARQLGAREVTIRLDSELVARQLSGEYRTRSPELLALAEEVSREARAFERCRFDHVPREENREADRLANRALNAATNSAES